MRRHPCHRTPYNEWFNNPYPLEVLVSWKASHEGLAAAISAAEARLAGQAGAFGSLRLLDSSPFQF